MFVGTGGIFFSSQRRKKGMEQFGLFFGSKRKKRRKERRKDSAVDLRRKGEGGEGWVMIKGQIAETDRAVHFCPCAKAKVKVERHAKKKLFVNKVSWIAWQ